MNAASARVLFSGLAGLHGTFGLGLHRFHSVETIGFDMVNATASNPRLSRRTPFL